MSSDSLDAAHFSADVVEFLRILHRREVRCLVVGGEAVIYYGHVRLTGDIDFFFDSAPGNCARLFAALKEFWGGEIPGVGTASELQEPGVIVQFGRPPNRIDLINRIDGVTFADAWPRRLRLRLSGASGDERVEINLISLEDLIANKTASGRPKDLADLAFLRPDDGQGDGW